MNNAYLALILLRNIGTNIYIFFGFVARLIKSECVSSVCGFNVNEVFVSCFFPFVVLFLLNFSFILIK